MPQYEIRVSLTLSASSQQEAQEKAAACVEYWDDSSCFDKISGVGCPTGYMSVVKVADE